MNDPELEHYGPTYHRYLWLIPLLLEDGPRTVHDIERTTEIDRNDLHDACWELERAGVIRILPDSRLELVR